MKKIKWVLLTTLLCIVISLPLKSQTPVEIEIITDIVYGHKDGMALTMDIYLPKNQNGAGVLFINSGGFRSPDFSRQCKAEDGSLWATGKSNWSFIPKEKLEPELLKSVSFEKLLENGFTVFDIRHGSTPKYMLDEIAADLGLAIKFLKDNAATYKVSKDRLGIWGASAGGYLAAYLAANSAPDMNLAAAVLYFPAGHDFLAERNEIIREKLPSLNLPDSTLDKLSLRHYVSSKMPPTLLLYGELDLPFITIDSDDFFEDMTREKVICEKEVFEGVGHMWLDSQQKYAANIGDQAMLKLVEWFKIKLLEE